MFKIASLLYLVSLSSWSADFIDCQTSYCEAIIDAGSSGTRLEVFQLNPKKFRWDRQLRCVYENKIPLAYDHLKAEDVDAFFKQLLPLQTQKKLAVYFYGTAGLRSVSSQRQKELYTWTKAWFKAHPQFELKEIRVLEGAEEGVLAWISNSFQYENPDLAHLGIIEVGGSSAQITFPTPKGRFIIKDRYNVTWFGKNLSLMSVSLPKMGADQVYKRLAQHTACLDTKHSACQFDACLRSIEQDMHDSATMNGMLPLVDKSNVYHWDAYGLLYYQAKNPLLKLGQQAYRVQDLKDSARKHACHQDWEGLKKTYPEVKYIERTCLNAAYIYWLLTQAFALPESTSIYVPTKKQGSWSEGSVIQRHM